MDQCTFSSKALFHVEKKSFYSAIHANIFSFKEITIYFSQRSTEMHTKLTAVSRSFSRLQMEGLTYSIFMCSYQEAHIICNILQIMSRILIKFQSSQQHNIILISNENQVIFILSINMHTSASALMTCFMPRNGGFYYLLVNIAV